MLNKISLLIFSAANPDVAFIIHGFVTAKVIVPTMKMNTKTVYQAQIHVNQHISVVTMVNVFLADGNAIMTMIAMTTVTNAIVR